MENHNGCNLKTKTACLSDKYLGSYRGKTL